MATRRRSADRSPIPGAEKPRIWRPTRSPSATSSSALSTAAPAARTLADNLRHGQLIILESTTFPGTTRDVMLPILEEGGLKAGLEARARHEELNNVLFHALGAWRIQPAFHDALDQKTAQKMASEIPAIPIQALR